MDRSGSKFRLNRGEGKVVGVCAGLADHFEIDVSLVRVAMALAILLTFPLTLFGYFGLALVAQSGGRTVGASPASAAPISERTLEATRQRMRDIDARMQAIEAHVTSSNTTLAREIDALR